MATTKARQLEKLAQSLPGANQQVQQGLAEARQTQLQETVRQAGPQAGTRAAQQIGAAQAGQAGQAMLQGQQQAQQQATQVGQLGLQEQARAQRGAQTERQVTESRRQTSMAGQLAQLDNKLKNELLDSQLNFQQDQAGNTILQERQLADWALTKAKSNEEMMNYRQQAMQAHDRKIQVLKAVDAKLRQVMEQGYVSKGKALDQESRRKLLKLRQENQKAIAKARNKAANSASMWQSAGTIGGAIVGGVLGGPAGAAAGASVGGGLGSMAGAASNNQPESGI